MRHVFVAFALVPALAPATAAAALDILCASACPGDRNAVWSADGRTIAFVDGILSPDLTRVAYSEKGADGIPVLVVQSEDGGRRVVGAGSPPEARALLQFSWSPDGARLAYVSDGECPTVFAVHLVRADGQGRRRLDHQCRIRGTVSPDRLSGTVDPDGMYGVEGSDVLRGLYGPDFIQGGAGNDQVIGGAGNDRLYGGPGRDLIDGGSGHDRIHAREGAADRVVCGTGDDRVLADRLDTVGRDCERVERR